MFGGFYCALRNHTSHNTKTSPELDSPDDKAEVSTQLIILFSKIAFNFWFSLLNFKILLQIWVGTEVGTRDEILEPFTMMKIVDKVSALPLVWIRDEDDFLSIEQALSQIPNRQPPSR